MFKQGPYFLLRDERLFEITKVEITRVDYKYKTQTTHWTVSDTITWAVGVGVSEAGERAAYNRRRLHVLVACSHSTTCCVQVLSCKGNRYEDTNRRGNTSKIFLPLEIGFTLKRKEFAREQILSFQSTFLFRQGKLICPHEAISHNCLSRICPVKILIRLCECAG